MKKGYKRFMAALLTISMISTMSLSTFAAKVIKPSSKSAQTSTEESSDESTTKKKVVKKKSETTGSTTSSTSSTSSKKTYKLGKTQFQTPKNWISGGEDESSAIVFAPLSGDAVMGVMAFNAESFYEEGNAELAGLNLSYMNGLLGVLAKESNSNAETKKLIEESLKEYAQEGQTIELLEHKTHPGIRIIMEEERAKGQVMLMIGAEEIIVVFGIGETANYDKIVSTLKTIVATVKTVK